MFKFIHDIDITKKKILNQLNNKLIINNDQNDLTLFEQNKHINSNTDSSNNVLLDKSIIKNVTSQNEFNCVQMNTSNSKGTELSSVDGIAEAQAERSTERSQTERRSERSQAKDGTYLVGNEQEGINNQENEIGKSKEQNINDKNCAEMHINSDIIKIRDSNNKIENEIFIDKSKLEDLTQDVWSNISNTIFCDETIPNKFKQMKQSNEEEIRHIVMKCVNATIDRLVHYKEYITDINYLNNVNKKYLDEIYELKKNEKILTDINERQTKQLIQLSGQISNIKNYDETFEEYNNKEFKKELDLTYLKDNLKNMETENKILKDEKQKLQHSLHDKLLHIKTNFELKCYIKQLEDIINTKSEMYKKLKIEKISVDEKVNKYYEHIQLITEDLCMHKNVLYNIKQNEKDEKKNVIKFINENNHRIRSLWINNEGTKIKMRKKKIKILYKQCPLHCNWSDNIKHSDANKNVSDVVVRNKVNTNHSATKVAKLKTFMEDRMCQSDFECARRSEKRLAIKCRDPTKVNTKNNFDLTQISKEKLIEIVNYYKLILNEYQLAEKKKKKNLYTNEKLKEIKKLLLDEMEKNKIIQKKYQNVLKKVTNINEDGMLIPDDKKTPESKTFEYKTSIKIQELLNEIIFLTKEIEKLKDDKTVLKQEINTKSEIISNLMKRNALDDQRHFRIDGSFDLFKNKLTYDDMKKVMEETLIDNIRLRTDLITLGNIYSDKDFLI
ncbi:conserved Plasmodium protein, unknown function [Plasmodium chabaudi chabaudi]|uniref:Uncharacterized protein n=1 Tax=Plasmodium chabaudi chabaudi TaxID=31271 RepID=A0A4V0K142_PLACU|nr:conserved Plasmodium protein, unknown function [Plasmodium chabaudi chabaudi]VTZ66266.1 conserved Plasmodium protein, unknown function [Plasmodium chabaudi chabaudi]|eukprot:XP_746203.2 conserved Plasmodium protein, unknown function [Plasmodium chabaudi chabaudi]